MPKKEILFQLVLQDLSQHLYGPLLPVKSLYKGHSIKGEWKSEWYGLTVSTLCNMRSPGASGKLKLIWCEPMWLYLLQAEVSEPLCLFSCRSHRSPAVGIEKNIEHCCSW